VLGSGKNWEKITHKCIIVCNQGKEAGAKKKWDGIEGYGKGKFGPPSLRVIAGACVFLFKAEKR